LQRISDVLYDPAADPERFGMSLSNSQEILSNCCNSGVFLPKLQIAESADQLRSRSPSFDHSQAAEERRYKTSSASRGYLLGTVGRPDPAKFSRISNLLEFKKADQKR